METQSEALVVSNRKRAGSRTRGSACAICLLFCMGAPQRASAETATPGYRQSTNDTAAAPRPIDAIPESRWYGYQPLIADGAALTLFAASVATFCLHLSDSGPPCSHTATDTLALSGVGTYLLGSPVIHAAHGHWDKAGMSLGMRGAPILLGVAVAAADKHSSSGAGAVFVVGVLGAMLVDDILLAREPVLRAESSWYVAPSFDSRARSASVTVGGQF